VGNEAGLKGAEALSVGSVLGLGVRLALGGIASGGGCDYGIVGCGVDWRT